MTRSIRKDSSRQDSTTT
ncbi:hypothetical protein Tco_0158846, partial [Tanacetum coccineum]